VVSSEDHCHPAQPEADASTVRPEPRPPTSRGWFIVLVAALTGVLLGSSILAYATLREPPDVSLAAGATIYFNEACGDCLVYLNDELVPALSRANLTPTVKDYINDRSFREELTALNDALGIPFELQSHLATFVAGPTVLVFEGHVPAVLVEEALRTNPTTAPPRLLVYQDAMGTAVAYRAWGFAGTPQTYPVATPLSAYLAWYAANVPDAGDPLPPSSLLPLVLTTGFLDGLNPCAFAVLLFFVAFLYAVRAPRREVWRMGSLYAYAVLVVYFLIGLGLLRAIVVSEDPHLIAKIAAVGVIGLGAWTLTAAAFPALRLPSLTHMPGTAWPRIKGRILSGSLPGATAAGLLVGLCTFPCSGGVYVAILGLLAANGTFLEGLAYLYLYNGMYILPLLAVLAGVSNRRVALAVAQWERSHAGSLRIATAATMLAMGVILLVLSV